MQRRDEHAQCFSHCTSACVECGPMEMKTQFVLCELGSGVPFASCRPGPLASSGIESIEDCICLAWLGQNQVSNHALVVCHGLTRLAAKMVELDRHILFSLVYLLVETARLRPVVKIKYNFFKKVPEPPVHCLANGRRTYWLREEGTGRWHCC